jgi:hypothetical protein
VQGHRHHPLGVVLQVLPLIPRLEGVVLVELGDGHEAFELEAVAKGQLVDFLQELRGIAREKIFVIAFLDQGLQPLEHAGEKAALGRHLPGNSRTASRSRSSGKKPFSLCNKALLSSR